MDENILNISDLKSELDIELARPPSHSSTALSFSNKEEIMFDHLK